MVGPVRGNKTSHIKKKEEGTPILRLSEILGADRDGRRRKVLSTVLTGPAETVLPFAPLQRAS